jgi:dolichol-phosphate mannosyltransferase
MQTWSAGVMCYNEAGTLERVVRQLLEVLRQLTNTFEVIIVDDCSTDGCREIALRLQQDNATVRVFLHETNEGIGRVLRTIYSNAQYENIGIVPGDGQFDTNEFLPFKDIPANSFVSFYRKENASYTTFRTILSLVNKKLNELFVGIKLKDVNWTKIYKKRALNALSLQLTSSLIESEICAKLLFTGNKVIEVESKYLPRAFGKSKGASRATIFRALNDTWTLVCLMRGFRPLKEDSLALPCFIKKASQKQSK